MMMLLLRLFDDIINNIKYNLYLLICVEMQMIFKIYFKLALVVEQII